MEGAGMFQGVYTALITPFDRHLRVDEAALRSIVNAQIEGGVSGLVPMGTTGESPTVSHRENVEVIRIVIDEARGRLPVIAGTGSNSTSEAVDMTLKAKELGASASLQVAPYYNKPNQDGFYAHFAQIAKETGLPLIVYNIPGRTGKNIESDTILRLAELENIVAVKEASGNIYQVMDILAARPAGFSVLSGVDELNYLFLALGGDGFISVLSNVLPAQTAELYSSARSGRTEEALRLHAALLPVVKALFLDSNPIPVKYALSLMGLCQEVYRLPLCETSAENKAILRRALGEFLPNLQ